MLMNGAILLVLSACSIELVHRFFDTVFDDGFGGLVRSVDRGFDGGQILFGGAAKDVVDLIVSVSGFADADADAGEGFVMERVDDGFQAVVPAVSSPASHADATRLEVDVVGDDDETIDAGLIVPDQGSGGCSGSIDVCLGIGDDGRLTIDLDMGDARRAFVLKFGVEAFAENVGCPPSDVMTSFGVFRARVADGEDYPGVGKFLRRLIVDLGSAGFGVSEKAREALEGIGFASHRSCAVASSVVSAGSGSLPSRISLN